MNNQKDIEKNPSLMVHKKSEYRLQFHYLPKDLRKEIWQENIKFRESRRSDNQAHHYWSYQLTDENCDCESEEERQNEYGISEPPHRKKHAELLARYKTRKNDMFVPLSKQLDSALKLEDTQNVKLISSAPDLMNNPIDLTDGSTVITANEELQKLIQENSNNPLEARSLRKNRKQTAQPSTTARPPKPSYSRAINPMIVDPQIPHATKKMSASNQKKHFRSGFGDLPSPSKLTSASVSRTSRRSYFERKKSPFVSFGWNDGQRNFGDKKTYNVSAPVSQNDVNHSSIWMSEYRDQYKQPQIIERPPRPYSAPSLMHRIR